MTQVTAAEPELRLDRFYRAELHNVATGISSYDCIRTAGEMSWALRDIPVEDLLTYEARVNQVLGPTPRRRSACAFTTSTASTARRRRARRLPVGGRGGTVCIGCQAVGDGRVRITVSDSGPGIPADELTRLFTPFDRLGAERSEVKGTGLGLALSKQLAEAMGEASPPTASRGGDHLRRRPPGRGAPARAGTAGPGGTARAGSRSRSRAERHLTGSPLESELTGYICTMRVSISVTNYSWRSVAGSGSPEGSIDRDLARVAQAADQGGIDTVWVVDHLLQADPTVEPGDTEMLEAYTTLGFLAARTERVRLGAMVSGVTFRAPALLVKAVTTLDVLSDGRAWLGIGAGYHGEEAEAMGLEMPPVAERFERLEETLQIATRMWAGDDSPYQGSHYRLQRPAGSPRPVRRPHPPILIGGTGEQKTLRLVARYADACNLFDIPDGGRTVEHKLEVLARHCHEAKRPYEAIEKTLSTRLEAGESTDEFVKRCAASAALGIEHVVVITSGPWTTDALATLTAAVPTLEELRP